MLHACVRMCTCAQVEVAVEGSKALRTQLPPDDAGRPPPPLTVASLSLKTMINPATQQNEVSRARPGQAC